MLSRNENQNRNKNLGPFSPYNCINSASQVVDTLVGDYLIKNKAGAMNMSQQHNIQDDLAWKYDPKYYSGMFF